MTLGFKTEIKKIPTNFPEKIMVGLYDAGLCSISKAAELARHPLSPFPESWKYIDTLRKAWGDHKPKRHTIRFDEKDMWHAGRNIHMVVKNRTPRRYQFAPLVPCVSTQRIEIKYSVDYDEFPMVFIDNTAIHLIDDHAKILTELAVNDGFDDIDAFFNYFNKDFTGKIIHWTDLKY